MATRAKKFHSESDRPTPKTRQPKMQVPVEYDDNRQASEKHQPKTSNSLKIKLDNLKTFEPLTENQKLFFDAYKKQEYFIMLSGSAGVGKCQGVDVEVNLVVSDELYEKLVKMT